MTGVPEIYHEGGTSVVKSEWAKMMTLFFYKALPKDISFIAKVGVEEFGWTRDAPWKDLHDVICLESRRWISDASKHPLMLEFVWKHMLGVATQWAKAEKGNCQFLQRYKHL